MFKWISSVALVLCIVGCSKGEVDAEKATPLISQGELITQLASETPPLVLDVRTPEEYAEGHVPTALNIPHTDLSDRVSEIEIAKQGAVVVYCKSGRRAGIAETVLREAGFTGLLHLEGDMSGWQAAGLPMEKPGAEEPDQGEGV
jgi:phage shock protein E